MSAGSRDGSRPIYDVVAEHNVRVPTRDGLTLATDLHRPAVDGRAADGPFPTVLLRTPYDRARPPLVLTARFFAARGYIFATQDCRGRFDSDGEFRFLFNEHHEGLDGHDTVEWIAAQPWSNGKVGTTGLSFEGAVQQAMAVTQPPHLTTQIVLDSAYNYYTRPIRHSGAFTQGIFLPYTFFMAMVGGKEAQERPEIKVPLREVLENFPEWTKRLPIKEGGTPLSLAPSYERWYFEMATKGEYDEFWQNPASSLEAHIDDYPDIPLCLLTSWYGHHAWSNLEKWRALRERNSAPVRLLCGIWVHGPAYLAETAAGEVDFGNDAAVGYLDDFRLRWFDRFLKDLDTGIDEGPPLRLFIMGGGGGKVQQGGVRGIDQRLVHGGRWRNEQEWPIERAEDHTLYLGAGGALSAQHPDGEPATSFTYDPRDPVPTIGGCLQNPIGVLGFVYGGAFDQRARADLWLCKDTLPLAARADVLVFRTEPLVERLEVTGAIEVRLWVSSSALDTDFTAKLIDEYPASEEWPTGFAMNLSDSIIRMRYRDGFSEAVLMEPGQVYEVTIGPLITSNLFDVGHRIRLDISSSSSPQFDPNPNTGDPLGRSTGVVVARNTVYHDNARPSRLVLPVVPDGS
ncbi:MAG: CocE/NonD family hydrolase [Actinomycetia bacterium]|nr:CocE/NonD family hydrolase [Actinomycetes bacterium]